VREDPGVNRLNVVGVYFEKSCELRRRQARTLIGLRGSNKSIYLGVASLRVGDDVIPDSIDRIALSKNFGVDDREQVAGDVSGPIN
jgi:hypothetical protein